MQFQSLRSWLAFAITAIWWIAVTLPLLLNYKQNYYVETKVSVKVTFVRLGNIFSELKENRKVLLFLISFFFYIDGVYIIIEMSTAYGKDVGISDSSMLLALLLTQVVAFPCSILFGKSARKYESEKLISVCIGAYFLIALMFVLGFITFQLQRNGSFYGRWKTSVFPMLGRKPL